MIKSLNDWQEKGIIKDASRFNNDSSFEEVEDEYEGADVEAYEDGDDEEDEFKHDECDEDEDEGEACDDDEEDDDDHEHASKGQQLKANESA